MVSIVIGVMCAFCYLFGVWVGRNKLKSNADQRIQSVESVESVGNNDDIIVRSNLEPFRVADTPQTDCNANQCVQRVVYVENDGRSRCRNCEHFERMYETPISSDGTYYTYVICTAKECHYESTDTPQKDKDKVVCPNCGRSDYIRSFEKDFGIKNSGYEYKCINCNTYISKRTTEVERSSE